MATTKNTSTLKTPAAAKSLADKAVATAKRASAANIDSYERGVQTIVDFEHKVADAVDLEPISSIYNAYAELTREIGSAQTSAARSLLKV